jgi:hypothetical protein
LLFSYIFFGQGLISSGLHGASATIAARRRAGGPLTILWGIIHIMHQPSHFLLTAHTCIAPNQYVQYKRKCKHSKMNIIIV